MQEMPWTLVPEPRPGPEEVFSEPKGRISAPSLHHLCVFAKKSNSIATAVSQFLKKPGLDSTTNQSKIKLVLDGSFWLQTKIE